jgi:hypothetical protein
MSFREKVAWISAVSMAAIFGLYFWAAISSGPHFGVFHLSLLVEAVIAFIVLQVALTIVVAMFAPKDAQSPRDERDRMISLKASRAAYSGLATGIACACLFAGFNPPIIFNANALLFVLVMTEIMRSAWQIVLYRRYA